ncbi:HIT family protein [Maritalea mediterranea]|uniref:HIT family protein n=1 Tax=Maritalea mediterranea TaxID=2909667 RepID=A0ABS9EAN2_9HYPH|nr:HIT family protein [Maritalea mediterranea]MCF4099902.1 HIT family protein [Maritalea mediterranea]
MSYDPDNIFTKIIAGEIPSHKVYEDNVCISIMDIMPEAPGHVLVVPKQGSRNLLDADADTLADVIKRVQKIGNAVKKAMNADGILLRQANEEAAGQTVYHLHFHLIPCHKNVSRRDHVSGTTANEELAANCEKIKAAL